MHAACMINSNGKFDKSKSKLGELEDHPNTLASMNNFIVIKTTNKKAEYKFKFCRDMRALFFKTT